MEQGRRWHSMSKGIREFFNKAFSGELSISGKIFLTISILWVLAIGYLIWWNGIKSPGFDKSFRWDEWIWFGVIPATVLYFFYFIWKNRN